MSAIAAFAKLRAIGYPYLTTREAVAALRVSASSASRTLRTLSAHGLTERVRHGLWRFAEQSPDARLVAAEVTRPYPAYISFASALAAHGAIDQIPREISLASLSRPKRVRTARGNFVVHRLAPEVFGGFEVKGDVAVATPEKAIFDFVYVTQASGDNRQRLPELDLPASFSRRSIDGWVKRISSRRLRRPVADRIARTLEHAEFEDALSAKRRL